MQRDVIDPSPSPCMPSITNTLNCMLTAVINAVLLPQTLKVPTYVVPFEFELRPFAEPERSLQNKWNLQAGSASIAILGSRLDSSVSSIIHAFQGLPHCINAIDQGIPRLAIFEKVAEDSRPGQPKSRGKQIAARTYDAPGGAFPRGDWRRALKTSCRLASRVTQAHAAPRRKVLHPFRMAEWVGFPRS